MTTPSPDAPAPVADLTAPIKTVQETASGFTADALDWVQHSTLHAAIVISVVVGSVVGLFLLRRGLMALLAKKEGTDRRRYPLVKQLAYRLVKSSSTLFLVILGCWLVSRFISMPHGVMAGLGLAFTIGGVVQVGLWVREVILLLVERRLIRQGIMEADSPVAGAIGVIGWLVNVGVWSLTLLLLLDNLGVNITALVAGLGIGGLAIGLAAQGIMADLFSALSIVFDKPFVRGDFITFNDKKGTIENVGLKTSRLRALSGELIVVANNQLLASVIHNYKQMQQRRVSFNLGIVYSTPTEVVERIPELLRQAVEAQGHCRFDRAHLTGFADSALAFEVVYFYLSGENNPYMDAHQDILLRIMRTFAGQGIEFAFPTRTVHLVKSEA